jgi:hypothetical protein
VSRLGVKKRTFRVTVRGVDATVDANMVKASGLFSILHHRVGILIKRVECEMEI